VVSRRLLISAAAALALAACSDQQDPTPLHPTDAPALASSNAAVDLRVLLKTAATPAMLTELGKYGSAIEQLPQIKGLTMTGKASSLPAILALPYVAAVLPPGAHRRAVRQVVRRRPRQRQYPGAAEQVGA
jgi:hypothetical protein